MFFFLAADKHAITHTVAIGGEDLCLTNAELQLIKLFSDSVSAGAARANMKVIT